MHGIEFVDEPACPVPEYIGDRHVVDDPEGEIQVRVAVSAVYGERAHCGSDHNALVLLGEPEHVLAQSIPLLNREHNARKLPRSTRRHARVPSSLEAAPAKTRRLGGAATGLAWGSQ